MIKTVVFISRNAFTNHLKPTPSTIAISIGAADEGAKPNLKRGFAGAIRLEFDDVYEESLNVPIGFFPDLHPRHEEGVRIFIGDAEVFDFKDAQKIIGFLDYYATKPGEFDLVVHCLVGVSRSAAVAQFASDTYGAVIDNANPNTSAANKRVLRILRKALTDELPVIFAPRAALPPGKTQEYAGVLGG